jgi:hypothetical protein
VTVTVSLAAIINEIDVYVLRLQQARDLLAASTMTQQRARERSRQTAIGALKRVRSRRSVQPRAEKKLTAGITTRKQEPAAKNVSSSHNGVPPTIESAERIEPSLSTPGPELQEVEGMPSLQKENGRATQQRRRLVQREKSPAKTESPKPEKTARRPVPGGWIVVSAEEAKRQRERAARPAQLHSNTPSIGLTGRRAFEALFPDTSESSSTSPNVKH